MNKRFILAGSMALMAAAGSWLYWQNPSKVSTEADGLMAESYEEYEEKEERTGVAELAAYESAIRTWPGENGPKYRTGYRATEFSKAKDGIRTRRMEDDWPWTERGPGNVAGVSRTMIVDANDASGQTILAGFQHSGLWKSTDAGASWQQTSANELPNLSVGSIAQCGNTPSVMYLGTGDPAGGGSTDLVGSSGIWKSTDGGESWELLPSTAGSDEFMAISRIIVDPNNPDLVIVATTGITGRRSEFSNVDAYVMRSEDGGQSWTRVLDEFGVPTQVIASPNDFNTMYAALWIDGLYKSTDAGLTWNPTSLGDLAETQSPITEGTVRFGRTEVAIAPSNPNRMYASVEYSAYGSNLYISDDAGDTWTIVEENSDQPTADYCSAVPSSPQGRWNNCIVVHPEDENKVYWGGVDLWKAEIQPDVTRTGARQFLGAKAVDIFDWMDFVQFSSSSGLNPGEDFIWGATEETGRILANLARAKSVELRFGPGRSQKAHRFTTNPVGAGAGVADADYTFQDYIDIPFEVWDVEANQQLMVGFRDQGNNGIWDLVPLPEGENAVSREYIFITDIPYNASTPDPNFGRDGGISHQQMYFLWPYLQADSDVTPNTIPESTLSINFGNLIYQNASIDNMANAYPFIEDHGSGNGIDEIHPDHHVLTFTNVNNNWRLLTANDGGIGWSDDDGVSWTEADDLGPLPTLQCVDADRHPTENIYVAGAWHNGSPVSNTANPSSSSDYTEVNGGDGMECVWNAADPDKIIVSSQSNGFVRTTDGGRTWRRATSGLRDVNANAPFISRLAYHPDVPERLFALGATGVWKSENFGGSWRSTRIDDPGWTTSAEIAVSIANPDVIWAGAAMIEGSNNILLSRDGGASFNPVENWIIDLGQTSGIHTHPTQEGTAYVLFSQANGPKILRTENFGSTWEDITGFGTGSAQSSNGFPNVALQTLVVIPAESTVLGEVITDTWLLAGTEIGLFISRDNGQSWALAENGLPSVSIWDMEVKADGQLVVGTYGRGIWSSDLGIEFPAVEEPPVDDSDDSDDSTDDDTVGLLDGTQAVEINVYPNPTADQLRFELPEVTGQYEIHVFSITGQRMMTETQNGGGKVELSLGKLQAGTYILQAAYGENLYAQKVVVEK